MNKKVFQLACIAIMVFLGAVSTLAQDKSVTNSKFDKERATKLGADEYGMRNYILCILKTGPKDSEIKGEKRAEIFKGHMANIVRLANEGKIALAGPFGENDKKFRGLFIYAVDNIADAEKLAATDSVIKSGMMVAEFVPWYGSAALMEVTSISEKIAEKEF